MAANETGVFVLGMHRSGTSAATRAVNLLGVPLAADEELKPASQNNPPGFWEVSRLSRLNNRLLVKLGGSLLAPPELKDGWAREPWLERIRVRARRLFERSHETDRWVWKDPRNCVLFPFWREVLDVRPVVVLVHREPLAVARSLQARSPRQDISTALALASWERHVRAALDNALALPTYVLAYEDLVGDPRGSARRLGTFLEHQGLECDSDGGSERIEQFVRERPAVGPSSIGPPPAAHGPLGEAELLDQQRELLSLLGSLGGGHARFSPSEIPPEAQSTEGLLAKRRLGDLTGPRPKARRRRRPREQGTRSAARGQRETGLVLWIVSGPSSVGKSRFLASPRAGEVTGLPADTPVLFPGRLRRDTAVERGWFLHYNILRREEERIMAGARRGRGEQRASAPLTFRDDRRWQRVVRLPVTKRAILLVADRQTLLERVERRSVTEEGRSRSYQSEVWSDVYSRIDVDAIYDAWREELARRGIPVLELDATRDDYPPIEHTR